MEWSRSDTIALATHYCIQCHGLGLRSSRRTRMGPCNCVLRAIFRACHARFRYCVMKEKDISRVSLERIPGREGKYTWGRKDEEYIADFTLVARRSLDDFEYRIFRYHHLLGADWKLCTRMLKMDRGNFFHTVYRIEQKLGQVFRELKPYPLYPVRDYFRTPVRERRKRRAWPWSQASAALPLRAPLLKTA